MIKPILFVLISSFFTGILFSQSSNVECDKLYAKPVPFDEDINEETYNEIQTDMLDLLSCGVDPIDILILTNGPLLGIILVDQFTNNPNITKITYQHLLDGLSLLKESENYQNLRAQIEIMLQLANLPASINNWEHDKILFEEFGIPDSLINKIPALLKNNTDSELTYGQLFEKLFPQKEYIFKDGFLNESGKEIRKIDYYDISKELTYSEAIVMSKELNKPILLYFTGLGCINARKLEHYVLSEEKIKSIIDDQFIFLPLYVDDETEIPQDEQYKSNYLRTTINSIGKKNLDFQIQKFKRNSQPFLVILNSDEESVGMIGYIQDLSEFEKFLTEGLIKSKK